MCQVLIEFKHFYMATHMYLKLRNSNQDLTHKQGMDLSVKMGLFLALLFTAFIHHNCLFIK